MRFAIGILTALLLTLSLYAVSTKYINDFKFEDMDAFTYSNVCFIEGGGVELARDTETLFESKRMLWSLETLDNGFVLGMGNPLELLHYQNYKTKTLYSDTNRLMVSDIQQDDKNLYFATIPSAQFIVMDKSSFKIQKTYSVSNEYIWSIVPYQDGFLLLCGNPAEIYLYRRDEIKKVTTMTNEKNLLKGVTVSNETFFSTEGNVLYKLKHATVSAVAYFDNNISDFFFDNGSLYVITTSMEIKKGQTPKSGNNSEGDADKKLAKNNTKAPTAKGKSILYKMSLDGFYESLFVKENIRFLSLSKVGDALIIGTDKDAGYFELGNDVRFGSYGLGQFVRFIQKGLETYAVLLEPSRIQKINPKYAQRGYFTSAVFDGIGMNVWGKPYVEQTLADKTAVKVFTRGSVADRSDLWGNWLETKDVILSGNSRFLQYRVELSGNGENTPLFRGIIIPYIQKNAAPLVSKLSVNYSSSSVKVVWEGTDENKDWLSYNIYLAREGEAWVRLNPKELEATSYELVKDFYPDGKYRVMVEVLDTFSNPPNEGKTNTRVSDYFYIDNTAPVISELTYDKSTRTLKWTAKDNQSLVYEAYYSVNGVKWTKILPEDSLYDSLEESFRVRVTEKTPFYVNVKVVDFLGNYATKGISVR